MNEPTSLEELADGAAGRVPQPAPRWLLRFGLPVLVIGMVLALLLSTAWTALVPARNVNVVTVAIRPVEVEMTEMPEVMNGAAVIQAPGWVEADPFPVYVAALTEGVVRDIFKVEGDRVVAGEVVAALVDDEARIRVAEAEAAVTFAMNRQRIISKIVQKATSELASQSEATKRVEVAKATEDRLQATGARLDADRASAEADAATIQDELDRKADLVEQGAVAEGVVIRLQNQVKAAQAKVESLKQERNALDAMITAANAETVAAEVALELLVHETIEVEKANLELVNNAALINTLQAESAQARLAFERCQVKSPVSGTVIELLSNPGSAINYGNGAHGSHILHIFDPKSLQVRADIPLADAAMVRVGQTANVVVDVLPDQVFQGRVTRFVNKADISKNTIEAKVAITDPSPLLKPDMLARVRIMPMSEEGREHGSSTVTTMQRVFVPESAIVTIDSKPGIWVVDELDRGKGRAAYRPLTLGEGINEGWVEVIDGMQPGDKVILETNGLGQGDHVVIESEREA